MHRLRSENTPAVLGGMILGLSCVLFFALDLPLHESLAQLSLPVVIGGFLLAYGYRVGVEFDGGGSRTVGTWTVIGIIALFLVGQWYVFLDWYVGQVSTILAVFAAITTGVLFGAFIGIYAERVNQSKAQLARRNEELAASKAQLAEQNERLEEFTSMVSHDLRNPLQVMGGFLDLAEQTGEQEYFDRCQNQVERMHQLIEDMLALARADADALDPEPTSLGGAARQAWETIDPAEATLSTPKRLLLLADGRQLEQLLGNLLKNALDHGGPAVTVTVGPLSDDAGFYVADDGPGIPADKRENVFEHGYSTGTAGTGYGLTIVERVVDVHDWEITVTESETGGARFEIRGVTPVSKSTPDSTDQETDPSQLSEQPASNAFEGAATTSGGGGDSPEAIQGP